jgi:hypothetical protein
MPTYLDFESDNNAISGLIHKFQTSTLEADHPPLDDVSNKVATTGWVSNLLTGNPMYPQVVQASNLSINVTEGYVTSLTGEQVLIPATVIPISVVGGATEYVYIRYADMKPVISTISPPLTLGFLLANVVSDHTQILSINQVTPGPTGLASNESPFFTGDPQAPTPPQGDYDNSIATTQWVKDELASVLGSDVVNRPTVTLSPPSTLLYSSGIVNIGGIKYNVVEGNRVFGLGDNGTYTVRGVLQVGNSALIEVSNTLPTNPYVDLASVDVNGGVLGELTNITVPVNRGDVSPNPVTTDYLTDMLMTVFHGIGAPKITISIDKTSVDWTNGIVKVNNIDVNIISGTLSSTLPSGVYYLHAQEGMNALYLTLTLSNTGYKILGRVEIFNNKIGGLYPVMPGFGG